MTNDANEIIGNTDLVSLLDGFIAHDKMPTALLLAGPAMVGKTTIIERVAKKILCQNRNECGVCGSCKIGVTNHPDVLRQEANEEESLRKGIATLLKRIHEKPAMANKLVVFLPNIDQFSWAAAPLLLKILEDAPTYVVFLLTADNLELVLPTIRSRALVRYVPPITDAKLRMGLIERCGTAKSSQMPVNDVDLIEQVVSLAGGRPGLAIKLLDDQTVRDKYLDWQKSLLNIHNMTIGERSQFAESIDKTGEGGEVLGLLQGLLRNQTSNKLEKNNETPAISKKLMGVIRRSREAVAMLRANVPQRLVLEYIFFIQ